MIEILGEIVTQAELNFTFGLVLSLLAGFIIGIERETRHKDAGISTHMLVIVGSMLFTFLSAEIEPDYASRIAAQVVMGIGFLGGGLILKDGTTVRNLTTAASLWLSAAIGMSFGFGFYVIGFISTIVAVLAPRIPHLTQSEHRGEEG